jgi:hypothetical protein
VGVHMESYEKIAMQAGAMKYDRGENMPH